MFAFQTAASFKRKKRYTTWSWLFQKLPSGGDDLLQSENRVNIKPESEVNVEAGIGQLFIVVGRQTADFVVKSRKYEMAAFDTR